MVEQKNKQVQINIDDLRKSKFFIATPCYGGQLNEPYFRSTIKLMSFMNQHQIPLAFGTIANESLVTRARNVLVAYFLNSDYTHLLFIDADIEFQMEDVLKLWHHDKDVVVGAYPKKGVAWGRIRENLLAEPNKTFGDDEICAFGSDYAVNFKFIDRDAKSVAVENGLIKLHDAGTGFMMIKREAILKMLKAYPELRYNNDVALGNQDLGDNFYALFDTMIDPKDKRYLSEDYTFCRRWQELGGDIWLDPSISLNHYGHFRFAGNPRAIIQFGDPIEATAPPVKKAVKTIDLPIEQERAA